MKLWIACHKDDVEQLRGIVAGIGDGTPTNDLECRNSVEFHNVEVSDAEFRELEPFWGHFVWGPSREEYDRWWHKEG